MTHTNAPLPVTFDDTPPEELLVDLLVEQCRHLSVTGAEAELADDLQHRYEAAGETVHRVGDSLVVDGRRDDGTDRPLVLLVGHLDVVPPTPADEVPRVVVVDEVPAVVGRGSSDMKAGNVAAMAVFGDATVRAASPHDLALVLYAREEGPAQHNELAAVLATLPWLEEADLAIVLEPTDLQVHAGCLGGLHARLTFRGRQAHSARPWHGENALTKAGALLHRLHTLPPKPVPVDGVTFQDVWSATQAHTDSARNVIPGTFTVNLNFRFAPNRDLATAERELRDLVGDVAEVEVVDRARPAPPHLDAPLVQAFVAAAAVPVTGKQAWTDVARFAARGVPALNFGPGLTAQAHQEGEHVPIDNLHAAVRALRRFLVP